MVDIVKTDCQNTVLKRNKEIVKIGYSSQSGRFLHHSYPLCYRGLFPFLSTSFVCPSGSMSLDQISNIDTRKLYFLCWITNAPSPLLSAYLTINVYPSPPVDHHTLFIPAMLACYQNLRNPPHSVSLSSLSHPLIWSTDSIVTHDYRYMCKINNIIGKNSHYGSKESIGFRDGSWGYSIPTEDCWFVVCQVGNGLWLGDRMDTY